MVNDILQAKGLLLRTGTAVDATLIAAPSSTKNVEGERDPQMQQAKKAKKGKKGKKSKKSKQWYFGMKAHIGVDAQSGFVHTAVCTAAWRGTRSLRGRWLPGRVRGAQAR